MPFEKSIFGLEIHLRNDLNIISIKSNLYTIMCDKGHIYQIDSCSLYHRKNVYNTILCTICNNISDKQTSGLETEFYPTSQLLDSLNVGKYEDSDELYPKSLDFPQNRSHQWPGSGRGNHGPP